MHAKNYAGRKKMLRFPNLLHLCLVINGSVCFSSTTISGEILTPPQQPQRPQPMMKLYQGNVNIIISIVEITVSQNVQKSEL